MKVSIFLPTAARFKGGLLGKAINSALSQTWSNFELLVVDDGSVDGTDEFLEQLASKDSRIKHIRLPSNTGLPAYALAQAYVHATGDYFAWLFDDCELEPDHLETLLNGFSDNPDAGMVYARARAELDSGSSFVIGSPVDPAAMEQGTNCIPNVCVMVPRQTIEHIGWYDPHIVLKRLCDWDLWLRIAHEYSIGFVDRILATEHGVGLPDSLGRIHEANTALAVRYAHTSRNHRLAPEKLSITDAFRRDLGFELDSFEQETLTYLLLDHAVLTMNLKIALDAVTELRDAGLLVLAADRLSHQPDLPNNEDCALLFSGLAKLFRRRLTNYAEYQIQIETTARETLRIADERAQNLETLSEQFDSAQNKLFESTNLVKDLQHQVESCSNSSADSGSVGPQEDNRFNRTLFAELTEAKYSLFVFRDAADRRMEMLHAAEARTQSVSVIAEQRLALIHDLQAKIDAQDAKVEPPRRAKPRKHGNSPAADCKMAKRSNKTPKDAR